MDNTDTEEVLEQPILTDLSAVEHTAHTYDHIVGNELHCSTHQTCTVIRVKPTEVLEKGADGTLQLVDKAPEL